MGLGDSTVCPVVSDLRDCVCATARCRMCSRRPMSRNVVGRRRQSTSELALGPTTCRLLRQDRRSRSNTRCPRSQSTRATTVRRRARCPPGFTGAAACHSSRTRTRSRARCPRETHPRLGSTPLFRLLRSAPSSPLRRRRVPHPRHRYRSHLLAVMDTACTYPPGRCSRRSSLARSPMRRTRSATHPHRRRCRPLRPRRRRRTTQPSWMPSPCGATRLAQSAPWAHARRAMTRARARRRTTRCHASGRLRASRAGAASRVTGATAGPRATSSRRWRPPRTASIPRGVAACECLLSPLGERYIAFWGVSSLRWV